MSDQVITALVASVIGGFLVALTNQLFTRGKTKAEAMKIEAEAGKIKAETAKLLQELDIHETTAVSARDRPLPDSWFFAGNFPYDYDVGSDRRIVHGGNASGYIKSRRPPRGFGTLMQMFKADKYRGKRLRISGYMKSENVTDWAGLWMRVDGSPGEILGFDNMQDRPIRGTTDWEKYEIVLDVPADSVNVAFGALLAGEGQIWVDDVQFETVGNDVPTTDLRTKYPEQPHNLDFETLH